MRLRRQRVVAGGGVAPVDQAVASAQQVEEHELTAGLVALAVDELAAHAHRIDLLQRDLEVVEILCER